MKDRILYYLAVDNGTCVSRALQDYAENHGCDESYDKADYIVEQFLKYDKQNETKMSEYDSLMKFEDEYYIDIIHFVNDDIFFEVKDYEF